MFMSNKDLPAHGKAFAWVVVVIGLATALWLVCDAIQKVM